LIGPHHFAPLLRVELAGERGGIHEITEQHRELAAFGIRGLWGGWRGQGLDGLDV
jgi:hypothetical protein